MTEQVNFTTQKAYQGYNADTLARTKYESNEWATYRQWLEAGFQVQKGEHGTPILKIIETEDGDKRPKHYKVFNFEQVKEATDEN